MSDTSCACGTHPQCACTPPLFPTEQKPRCKACGSSAKNACGHDADLEHGTASRTRKRPKSCLNNT